jgi:pimeloyl-ACP methyl ester carboxylesterase
MPRVREYGSSGPLVMLLHGGPGAPGYLAPLARSLAERFRVLEPFQRPSGDVPLTVALHVEDLHEFIGARRPALVGHSWGAMLALAYAAAHPESAGPIVLVGCGTFDEASRARFHQLLNERLSADIAAIETRIADPDELLRAKGRLWFEASSYDIDAAASESPEVDARANAETWADMLRIQKEGVYPAAFRAIRSPVLMLHGAAGPHPGRMILESLRPSIPHIEYREWPRCGHYPWLERHARREFVEAMEAWLLAQCPPPRAAS